MALNSHVSLVTLICITTAAMASSSTTDEFGDYLVLREEPSDATFLVGSRMTAAVFICDVEGSPNPTITWYRNGIQLGKDDQYRINGQGNLDVQNPTRSNHGDRFMCIANNSFGSLMSRNATLEIAYTNPFLNDRPQESFRLSAFLGKCLPCNPPEAWPGIQFMWRKEGVSGTVVDSEDGRVAVLSDGKLCFANLVELDDGTYQCLVANSFDNNGELAVSYDSSPNTVRLEVTESSGPPHQSLEAVGSSTGTVTVKRGQTAVLECFFLGRPTPTRTWTRTNGELPAKATNTAKSLVITDAQIEDSGEYTCEGRIVNSARAIVRRTLVVTSPPVLTKKLNASRTVAIRTSVSFRCEADADDAYEWFFNTQPMTPTARVQLLEDNTLHIKTAEPGDSGIYQCRVSNQYGSVLSTTQLKVKELRDDTGSGKDVSGNDEKSNIPEATGDDRGSSEVKQASVLLLITMSLLTSFIVHRC